MNLFLPHDCTTVLNFNITFIAAQKTHAHTLQNLPSFRHFVQEHATRNLKL